MNVQNCLYESNEKSYAPKIISNDFHDEYLP